MLTVEPLTTIPEIQGLFREWQALADQDQVQGFFRRPSWYVSWIQHLRPDATPLVLALRDGDVVVAIAPFCIIKQTLGLRTLSFGGSDLACGEYLDLLSAPQYRRLAARQIWEWLRGRESHWDMVMLDSIPSDGELSREARGWSRDAGMTLKAGGERSCPFVHLPCDFEEYLERLSRKRRKNLHRALRVFREQGVVIKTMTAADDVSAAIDTLVELHRIRWSSLGRLGTLGQAGFRAFLKSLCSMEAPLGTIRMYTVEIAGAPIAAMLNFHHGKSALQFQNGFDPHSDLAHHSPGTVLILHAIENAVKEGLSTYDFLRGTEDYKFQFADSYRKTETLLLARTLPARVYLYAKQARMRLRNVIDISDGHRAAGVIDESVYVPR